MGIYRKKPISVEAVIWYPDENGEQKGGWPKSWGDEPSTWEKEEEEEEDGGPCLVIPVNGGEVRISPGDWIIRGVAGEFYPCAPDIFDKIYEVVKDGVGVELEKNKDENIL